MRLTTSDSAKTVHWAFMGMDSLDLADISPNSWSETSRARLIASTKTPAPAAHFSFTAKSRTLPVSSIRIARASSAPTSMTVRASGINRYAPRAQGDWLAGQLVSSVPCSKIRVKAERTPTYIDAPTSDHYYPYDI